MVLFSELLLGVKPAQSWLRRNQIFFFSFWPSHYFPAAAGHHEDKAWYHGELSRDEAAEKLMNLGGRGSMQRDGYFLVRRGRAGLVLSVLEHADVRNYLITEVRVSHSKWASQLLRLLTLSYFIAHTCDDTQ